MNIKPIKQQFLHYQILAMLENSLESIQFIGLLSEKGSLAFNPVDVDKFKEFMRDNLDIEYSQWKLVLTDKERTFGCGYILSIAFDSLSEIQKSALLEYKDHLQNIVNTTL